MTMKATLALLGQREPKAIKNKGGRPSKINQGWEPDTKPGWMLYRASVVLEVVQRERANGKTRKQASLAAISEWKRRFPGMLPLTEGKLCLTEVDNILCEFQPEKKPEEAWQFIEKFEQRPEYEIADEKMILTGRWVTMRVLVGRVDKRPQYRKRGSGKKENQQFFKRYLKK